MKLTVGKKIAFVFLVLIAIIIVTSAYSIFSLYQSNETTRTLYEKHLLGVEYIKQANVDLVARGRAEKNLILAASDEEMNQHIASMESYSKMFLENVEKFESTVVTTQGQETVQGIQDSWSKLLPLQTKIIELSRSDKDQEVLETSKQIRAIADKIEADIASLSSQKDVLAQESYNQSSQIFKNTFIISLALIIAAILLSIVSGIILTTIIAKPLLKISAAAAKISNGDLSIQEIQVKNRDEIGTLAKAFNQMVVELRKIIAQVAEVSQTVSAASQELTASAEETTAAAEQVANTISNLAQGAESQSHELESASQSIHRITESIRQSAANTGAVSAASQMVSQTAKQGVNAAQAAVATIHSLEASTSKTSDAIFALGKESEKIGQIVDVIVSIAEQTNLLALNAAIEAARAGEHGRGFAVVSEEIRKLAEQSSVSAKQITELIRNIQGETSRAMSVMEESSAGVKEGVSVVTNAGDFFEVIVGEVDQVVGQIAQLNEVTQQIAKGSNEIVKIMESLSSISEENAASSEEVLATTEEQTSAMEEISHSSQDLSRLAMELQGAIAKFTL